MALVTRSVSNVGYPLVSPNGTILKNTHVIFTLVNSDGVPVDVWDATTHERVVGVVDVTTDINGEFSVALWPNDRGNLATQYLCHVSASGVLDFISSVASGGTTLSWIDFMTNGTPLTPQQVTALNLHIADTTTAHGIDVLAPARLYGRNPSTTTGLTLGYYGGTLSISGTLTTIANGTLALTANATNYVEAEPSTGAVSSNTTAFTSTRIQLYSIVTGASTVTSYTDMRSFIPSAQLGDAYGVATLDSTGHIPLGQLPAAIAGAMSYMGTWNASTNSPALASGVGTKGYYYKVATAGTTSLDGHAVWTVDDVAVFDGTTWDIIQGGTTAGEINTALGFTLSGTAAQTYSYPTTTATIARTDAGQTFTGVQNFTSPAITTNITTPSASFDVFNTTATTVNAFGAATSLSIGAGTGTLTLNNAAVKFGAGTVGTPSIYLSTDTTTGLYRIGANNLGVAVSGVKVLDISASGLAVTTQPAGDNSNLTATTAFAQSVLATAFALSFMRI